MKNITLSVDEKVLSAVRQHAAARSTSVNQLVRDYLGEIAQRESRARKARRRLHSLSNRSVAKIGRATWTRAELHER
jgi:metal-responsive CopG/Arc/MetJ family transcriptional regulator